VRGVLEALAARGIVGGCDVTEDYPSLGNGLLVCATETRTARTSRRMPGARRHHEQRGRG